MQKRISFLDLLRVAASVFVVFMHTAARGLRTDPAGHTGWFVLAGLSSLAFCAVPLFFMITHPVSTKPARISRAATVLSALWPGLSGTCGASFSARNGCFLFSR